MSSPRIHLNMNSQASEIPDSRHEEQHLFVTGCFRSGTTLLEKVLHNHQQAIVGSQPFPVLYFDVKRRFLDARQLQRRYPLDHLFLEDAYRRGEFYTFLDQHALSRDDVNAVFDQLEAYTEGLWTPEILQFRDAIEPGLFWGIYRQLNHCVARLFPKEGAVYIGGKEILCEEYLPYLAGKGVKAIVVIRDPRDMITSLNFRERDNLTGANRPVLYSLRAWRKSVALALACEHDTNFLWLRYEDLVERQSECLDRLTRFLGLIPYPPDAFAEGIRDQRGGLWRGNSSFQDVTGLDTASVGQYRRKLPPSVTRYIETVCLPEMRALGYAPHIATDFDPAHLREYRDPFSEMHKSFPKDYSSCPKRIDQEVTRIRMLSQPDLSAEQDIQRWFIDERALSRLREAMAAQEPGTPNTGG